MRRGELRGQDTCLEAGVLHGDDATEGDLASRAAGSGQDDELLVQLHGNLHLYDPPAGIGILHAQNLGDVDHTASAHGDDAVSYTHLITDGGGYLQPHPLNPGFVEYERFGLDLRRKDSFPLTDRTVQTYYLEAAEACQIQLTGIYLYLLGHQGFIKFADRTPQGLSLIHI